MKLKIVINNFKFTNCLFFIFNKIVLHICFSYVFVCTFILHYGSTSKTVSSKLEIIGIDIDTIIIFPPISTLFAIADSPVSLHMLTANSVKNAIPVILINKVIF